jgi:hypothetical protein
VQNICAKQKNKILRGVNDMQNSQLLMQTNPMQISPVVMSRSLSHFAWLPVLAVEGANAADDIRFAGISVVDAYAANRLGNGRIAAAAHAWDTNGGVPEFQANVCTEKTSKSNKTSMKTVKTTVKTIKRPLSWCGPPNG